MRGYSSRLFIVLSLLTCFILPPKTAQAEDLTNWISEGGGYAKGCGLMLLAAAALAVGGHYSWEGYSNYQHRQRVASVNQTISAEDHVRILQSKDGQDPNIVHFKGKIYYLKSGLVLEVNDKTREPVAFHERIRPPNIISIRKDNWELFLTDDKGTVWRFERSPEDQTEKFYPQKK